ncbi:Plasmid-related protein [Pseudomonas chlororaphis subsp. aureofaciens]|uniref:phage head morphogenesis protein n=1 Tax=Pseudomonas chlororaphis TaxID=587753 RepID=UPI000F6C03E5|nr:phage minor head protein [Pseudomonas chlororaphis]AZD84999.1 Plasmid-related protein [Pseudomonas chlororaphis subsp. aureofaciens]
MQRLIGQMLKAYRDELKKAMSDGPITLDATVATMARRALTELKARFTRLFSIHSKTMIENLFGQIDQASKNGLKSSLRELSGGITLKTPSMPAALVEMMQASTTANVSLIKSIPAEFHAKIEGVVLRSIQPGGNGLQDVFEALSKQEGITQRRAKFIAEDQTRKVTTAMNSARMQSTGIKQFEWIHSGGGAEPRKLHLDLDGQVFRFDDLPVIDERTGERGLPGQLPNCRCTMRPVLNFGEDET